MARLSLGDFSNSFAKPASLQGVDNINEGFFEGTRSIINEQAQHLDNIRQAQRQELVADVNQYKNLAEANLNQANQEVLEGSPAENYSSRVNELNNDSQQSILDKWGGTELEQDSKELLSVFDGQVKNKAFELERGHVNTKINAQTLRGLDELSKNGGDPMDNIGIGEQLIASSRFDPVTKEKLVGDLKTNTIDGHWRKTIQSDTNLLTLEAYKESIPNAQLPDDNKAILLNMVDTQINSILGKQKEIKREVDYDTKTRMAELKDQISNGISVTKDDLAFMENVLDNTDLYEKNASAKIALRKSIVIANTIDEMSFNTIEENQLHINQLQSMVNSATGEEATSLINKISIMQSLNAKKSSAVSTDGITEFFKDTGEFPPPIDLNNPKSIKDRASYADRASAKYGKDVSIFDINEQEGIKEQLDTMTASQVVNLLGGISANTRTDATLKSITKSKNYINYAGGYAQNPAPEYRQSAIALVNGGKLINNIDGQAIGGEYWNTVRGLVSEEFLDNYGDYYKNDPQLLGSMLDMMTYSYANQLGTSKDAENFRPTELDDDLFDNAVNTLNSIGEFNNKTVMMPIEYKGRQDAFNSIVSNELKTIFKDSKDLDDILDNAELVPIVGGYGVMKGSEVLKEPKTGKAVRL